MEYALSAELGCLYRTAVEKGVKTDQLLTPLLLYKYMMFETSESFLPQYRENMERLIEVWKDIVLAAE